jgi:hypothetical protein
MMASPGARGGSSRASSVDDDDDDDDDGDSDSDVDGDGVARIRC